MLNSIEIFIPQGLKGKLPINTGEMQGVNLAVIGQRRVLPPKRSV